MTFPSQTTLLAAIFCCGLVISVPAEEPATAKLWQTTQNSVAAVEAKTTSTQVEKAVTNLAALTLQTRAERLRCRDLWVRLLVAIDARLERMREAGLPAPPRTDPSLQMGGSLVTLPVAPASIADPVQRKAYEAEIKKNYEGSAILSEYRALQGHEPLVCTGILSNVIGLYPLDRAGAKALATDLLGKGLSAERAWEVQTGFEKSFQ